VWGINAAQLSLATTDPAYVRGQLFDRYAGGVYLHWSFWCNVRDPIQRGFCQTTLDSFAAELVDSARERDYRYAIYRLKRAPAAEDARKAGPGAAAAGVGPSPVKRFALSQHYPAE
jgi:hypothetical protein